MFYHRGDSLIHIPVHLSHGHCRTKERIFTKRFLNPPPAQFTYHINARSKHLPDSYRIQFAGNMFSFGIRQCRIEGASQCNILRIYGGTFMNHSMKGFRNRKSRDAQTGMPDQIFLYLTEILAAICRRQRKSLKEPIAYISTSVFQFIRIQLLAIKNPIRMKMGNLPYLLFQSHSAEQVVDTFFYRQLRVLVRKRLLRFHHYCRE